MRISAHAKYGKNYLRTLSFFQLFLLQNCALRACVNCRNDKFKQKRSETERPCPCPSLTAFRSCFSLSIWSLDATVSVQKLRDWKLACLQHRTEFAVKQWPKEYEMELYNNTRTRAHIVSCVCILYIYMANGNACLLYVSPLTWMIVCASCEHKVHFENLNTQRRQQSQAPLFVLCPTGDIV